MTTPAQRALLEEWRGTPYALQDKRDELFNQLIENRVFPPGLDWDEYEVEGGLYPDLDQPNFLPRLLSKREFQESKQKTVKESFDEGNGCRTTEDFEITPVQRFVSRLLAPSTPYQSALLYHGVGVGKTCAAVTVAETYLRMFPSRKVYIVAPPNIQEGFKRTIFDVEGLKMGPTITHRGCTGDTYLKLAGITNETKPVIEGKVTKIIKKRYEFFGYTSFYNHIQNLTSRISTGNDDERERQKFEIYRREFSNRVLIIDEAHNLRDNPLESEEDRADDMPAESSESKAGKKLTPYLREVLDVCEGITLLLMTATPMYNSYTEIIFLLNLLLTNDKFKKLVPDDVFDMRKGLWAEGGQKILGKIASQYISFMRGENPLTFPIRLEPRGGRITEWPTKSPKGEDIPQRDRETCVKLPLIGASFSPETAALYNEQSAYYAAQGMGITNMDILIQAGNWIFPGDSEFLDRVRQAGFENTFTKEKRGSQVYYSCEDPSWLLEENIASASGKCATLLKRLNSSEGVSFIYSRFVQSGALMIALALEANGYACWGRDGFLQNGNQHPDGRICVCGKRENGHTGDANHTVFKQAKYILLTGSEELSPNNAKAINAVRATSNMNGNDVKVVIGSQIAGEGLDLRYIREIMVFDSWYHLNKLEQIIGRGIRTCSHALLNEKKRNCTITLLVNLCERESIDLYSYRQAMKKAIIMGSVTRTLKEYAIDCTLNREAILVKNLDPITLIDSQKNERRDQPINDVPLTPMCDWLETCDYDCKYAGSAGPPPTLEIDDSTYDEYAGNYQMSLLRKYFQDIILKGTPFVTFEAIESIFPLPRPLLISLLKNIDQYTITTPNGTGHIIYRNGYYLFQPDKLKDTGIPIALRLANIPIPRDKFVPTVEEVKIVRVDEDTTNLWNEATKWAEKIRNGLVENVPMLLLEEITKLREFSASSKSIQEIFEMVVVLNRNMPGEYRVRFAEIVLEYIWDVYVSAKTKRALIRTSPVAEPSWEFEGYTYIRFVNGNTNEIEYLCDSGPCSKAIIEILEKEGGRDPLNKPINDKGTGFTFGFLVFNPKKEHLVFKNSIPSANGKIQRGSECSVNSTTTNTIYIIEKLDDRLKTKVNIQLEMKRIQNSVRVCTILQLLLRFMDKLGIQEKRWFYRPLEMKVHNPPLG